MKKFYTLLLFVLAIPMSTMAQITHRFPELIIKEVTNGTEGSRVYYLAAWDALTAEGFLRVQATTVPEEDPIPEAGGWDSSGSGAPGDGIIINGAPSLSKIRRAPRHAEGKIVNGHSAVVKDNSTYPITAIWKSTINVYYNNNLRKTAVNLEAWDLTYGDILTTEEMPDETMRAERLFIEVNEHNISGDYVIPEVATDSKFAEEGSVTTYNIVGIGDCAFYNRFPRQLDQYEADANGVKHEPFMRATTLTIPKHIKSLGERSFYGAGFLTKVTIADESNITTIPTYCFSRCLSLREINIPNSVTKIGSYAFGNTALGKIQFGKDRSTPPTITSAFSDASSSTPSTNKALCAVWVKDLETVKAFRNASTDWNALSFCVPFELKKQIVSYCSDLPLSAKSLQLGSGMIMNDPASGSTTYYNPNTWVLETNEDSLKMYYFSKSKDKLNPQIQNGQRTITMTQLPTDLAVKEIGVLMSGLPGVHPLYIKPANTSPTTYENYLVGTLESTPWFEEEGYTNYLLKDGKFYLWGWDALAANKAYLKLPNDLFDGRPGAKELNIVFDDETGETDAVKGVTVAHNYADNAWYTLQGVRVESPQRGVFIRGGKKYVIK